jgi:hypothetical protein
LSIWWWPVAAAVVDLLAPLLALVVLAAVPVDCSPTSAASHLSFQQARKMSRLVLEVLVGQR